MGEPTATAEPAWREFARAPLVPVALAAAIGLVIDRYAVPPLAGELLTAGGGVVAWGVSRRAAWLWLATAGLAAAHHHTHRAAFAADDIAGFATARPAPARVRGTLDEEPARFRPPRADPLVGRPMPAPASTTLAVTAVETSDGWRPASGRARLTVDGRLDGLHLGDAVEVAALLSLPDGPSNPGELDYAALLRDRRITAILRGRGSTEAVTRLDEGWRNTPLGWVAALRGWGTRALTDAIDPDEAGLAAALLLGDGTALDRAEWDAYVRTGVVHVLAISGQHLVVLGWFAWLLLRVAGVRRRHGAWAVALLLVGYAVLTGGRPSAVRAAVMVSVVCGAIVLRRPQRPANAFALAWLIVLGFNPADPFTAGCQLSFVSVFVLVWGAGRWLAPRPLTPLEELVEESRTLPERLLRRAARWVAVGFAVSVILGVVNGPLVLAWQNIASPVGVVLGPPLVFLTSVALLTGFVVLLTAPLAGWLAWPFARVTEWSLAGCGWLVDLAERVPGGWVYAPAPPAWWLVGFYALVAVAVLLDGRGRRVGVAVLAAWLLLGLVPPGRRLPADELLITFLHVGHGGCIVLEPPDGRVMLYDAGTTLGPDAIRRTVAPYLWHRGVRRVDEVFVSHADLDHFNGVPALLDRFPLGLVTLTPSFRDRPTPAVRATLEYLEKRNVPTRVASAGNGFAAGDVTIEVLHPPADGPPGEENVRSLVLLVRHAGNTVLVTGDLEGEGQERVTRLPAPRVDVLLAPHHGAKDANTRRAGVDHWQPGPIALWARPRLAVSCQKAGSTEHLRVAYAAVGADVWDTPTAGAIVLRSHPTGLVAEAFRTGEVRVVRRGW
ncbi:MAG: ComEC/Rec2 family competence protein [Gemmataceae bacterium]